MAAWINPHLLLACVCLALSLDLLRRLVGDTWLNGDGDVILDAAGNELVCDDCPCGCSLDPLPLTLDVTLAGLPGTLCSACTGWVGDDSGNVVYSAKTFNVAGYNAVYTVSLQSSTPTTAVYEYELNGFGGLLAGYSIDATIYVLSLDDLDGTEVACVDGFAGDSFPAYPADNTSVIRVTVRIDRIACVISEVSIQVNASFDVADFVPFRIFEADSLSATVGASIANQLACVTAPSNATTREGIPATTSGTATVTL